MYKVPIIVIECDKQPSQQYKRLLHFIDILVSLFVITPLTIANWRGVWNLFEIYLLPENPLHSALASFFIGNVGYMIFMLPQKFFCDNFDRDKHRLTFYLFSRFYTFIFGVISVHGCRGLWNLANILTTVDVQTVFILTSLAATGLVATRSLANISAPPFAIATDEKEDYFLITTRFNKSPTKEPFLFILDCIFSTFVLGTLVALLWRGVWIFFDLVCYPEDIIFSGWASLIIGYGLAIVAFAFQPLMRKLCDQFDGFIRIALADLLVFFSFIGTMSIWRGIWELLDIYLLPGHQLESNLISWILSFILLMFMNCSNTILARGVAIDAECESGRCVVFPIHYIRSIFAKQRSKQSRYLTGLLGEQYRGKIIVVLENHQPDSKGNIIRIDTCVTDDAEKSESSSTKEFSGVNYGDEESNLIVRNSI